MYHTFLIFGQTSLKRKKWIASNFEIDTGKCTIIAHLRHREYAGFIRAENGECMILGGWVGGRGALNTVELFSFKTRCSRLIVPLQEARQVFGTCMVDNTVVVCGGIGAKKLNSCEVYLRSENRWIFLPTLKEARYGVANVTLPDRRIFSIGGENEIGVASKTVEVFQLPIHFALAEKTRENDWKIITSMREARIWPAATLLEKTIFVAGGFRCGFLSSVEMFTVDVEDEQWITLRMKMRFKRCYFTLIATTDSLLAFGKGKYSKNSVQRINLERRNFPESNLLGFSEDNDISTVNWNGKSFLTSMKSLVGVVLCFTSSKQRTAYFEI